MEFHYSSNRNVQMLISLLKANGIKKVIVSPGATHICFVASLQQDDYFELYSAVDERGAAYMACGLAMESGEPVVITCTGATASRNYISGLSEAYYRKLPILAVTGAQDAANTGHLIPQFVDRTQQLNDDVTLTVNLQEIKDENDEWDCNVKINKALLALRKNGGGPVHINLTCVDRAGLVVEKLPETRVVRRITSEDKFPEIDNNAKIAITVGAHKIWSDELTKQVDEFCEKYNCAVLCDHSSNYHGKYKILPTIASSQEKYSSPIFDLDLLIHIGEQSGDYYTFYELPRAKEVWRISEDGELRDTFRKLTKIFDMSETAFFKHFNAEKQGCKTDYYEMCKKETAELYDKIPELPLSNIWLAQQISARLPENSVLQLGVSNTMRSWTFFELPNSVMSIANVGCRGIDGAISTTIGMSLANKSRIHFCVLGDLTFFYNMNALGNRHIGPNLRILLINNGRGAEFHLYQHTGRKQLGDDVDTFVAAGGHNGKKSPDLVRHYSQDYGFEYLTASSKDEALNNLDRFLTDEITDKPMLFEIFTDCKDESDALKLVRNMVSSNAPSSAKDKLKHLLGEKGTNAIKKVIGR